MPTNDYFRYFEIISKHAHVYLDNALEKYGLNHCYRIYIKKICENPGISRDVIKNYTHVHPSNTSRAIDYLADNGFIEKKINNEDKRICNLYPCEKIKMAYNDLVKAENEWIDKITANFNDGEKEELFRMLKISQDLSTIIIHGEENGSH